MQNILPALIAFLGLAIGVIIAYFTKEELKPGKKYFSLARKLILIILIGVFVYFSTFNLYFFLNLVIGFITGHVLRKIYLYLSLAIVLAFRLNNEILMLVLSLVFIFGLFEAALMEKKITVNLILFILPLSLLVMGSDNTLFLSGFLIGALINFLK